MTLRFLFYSVIALCMLFGVAFIRQTGLEVTPALQAAGMLVIFLAGLALLMGDPLAILAIAMTFMPFSRGVLQFEIGVITFSPFSMGLLVLAAYTVFLLSVSKATYRGDLFDLLLVALCAFYLFHTLYAEDLMVSGLMAFHSFFVPCLLYFTLKANIHRREDFDLVFNCLMLGLFTLAVFNISGTLIHASRVGVAKVFPVSTATLMLLPVMFFLYARKPRTGKAIGVLVVFAASLFLTFSRVYLILVIISPLVMAAIRRGRALLLYTAMMILTLGFTFYSCFSIPDDVLQAVKLYGVDFVIEEKLSQMDSKGPGRLFSLDSWTRSMELRELRHRVILDNFLDHPVIGVGLKRVDEALITPHNLHVEWLTYGGMIGHFLYALTLFIFFLKFNRLAMHDNRHAILVCTAFFILINSTNNGLFHGFFSYMLYTVIGLSHAWQNVIDNEQGLPADGAAHALA